MSNHKNRFTIRSQILSEEGKVIRVVGNFIRTGWTTPTEGKPSKTFLFHNLRLIDQYGHTEQVSTPHLWVKLFEIKNPEKLNGITRNSRVIFEGVAMSYTYGDVKPKCAKGGLTSVKIISIETPTESEIEFLEALPRSNTHRPPKRKSVKSLFASVHRATSDVGWEQEKKKLAQYGFDL